MTPVESLVWSMSSVDLLASAHELVRRSHDVEAELLVHLGEIDERRLYLDCSFPSMFAFCVGELGFSEDAAYNRILVARAGRRLPAIVDAIREGRVHLWGMRLLVPHLTEANHRELIARAEGKTKRDIEEVVASLAPREPVASMIRSVPARSAADGLVAALASAPASMNGAPVTNPALETSIPGDFASPATSPACPPALRIGPAVVPLTAQTYKVQFPAGREFRNKLREAQDLMRHRVPDGNLETILGAALDLLIDQVKKERFAVGRKPRAARNSRGSKKANADRAEEIHVSEQADPEPRATQEAGATQEVSDALEAGCPERTDQASKSASRHIPDAIRRAVYERDGGRCTFVDEHGRRCPETGALEIDHVEGFAETGTHEIDKLRLLCRAHNQREAEKRYGRAFMDSARKRRDVPPPAMASTVLPTCSGTSRPPPTPE
jgi:hypothetical protein